MSIFDLFKTQWSAGTMTQDDRKKLFWYLKRKTSYAAWKRKAEAFDRFAEIFEKQVKEEPVARDGPYKTSWDTSYPEIVKGQVFYEQGLERLKQGDRTVWIYNDRGVFEDASAISGYWYSVLVNNGPYGDIFLIGKYVDELTEAIKQVFLASQDTGYLQPQMADRPAPELWSSMWHDDFAKMPLPAVLADVPVPSTEILFKTGQEVPVFGIYEPQIKDGCMNYLLAGTPAPKLMESDGTYATDNQLAVVWRLIWEDTRYLDGEIPSEESHYFPLDGKAAPIAINVVNDLLSVLSGKSCPKSGTWAVMDNLNASRAIKQGQTMPQHDGRDVTWVWVG